MSALNRGYGIDSVFASPVHRSWQRTALSASTDGTREHRLAQWIEHRGGRVGPVEICRSEQEGWFLQAKSDITKDTDLIFLPGYRDHSFILFESFWSLANCQLSYNTSDDAALMSLIERVPEAFWSGRLCLKLLVERLKGDRSPFWPYLESLPLGVPGVPLFYSEGAINALQYPPLIEQIKKRCRWLMQVSLEERQLLSRLAEEAEIIPDRNLLGWALAVVASRAFRVHGESQPGSMLPLIDLCNHSFEPNCDVQSSAGAADGVRLTSARDISRGDALFINYGNLSNDDLLLDYGFIIQENPHDTVQLTFSPDAIDTSDNSHEIVASNASQNGFGIVIKKSGEPLVDISLEELGSLDHPLDDSKAEIEALKSMATMMVAALSRFPEDVHSDRQRLQSHLISDPNERLSIAFRAEKKELLLNAIRHIANKIRRVQA